MNFHRTLPRHFACVLIGIVGLVWVVGCSKEADQPSTLTKFEKEDAGMNAAIEQARGTVETFITRVGQPATERDMVNVKIAMRTETGGSEHFWCDSVTYENGVFSANIANEPGSRLYKFGQRVEAKQRELSDWMFVENGKLVGGYTLRYMYSLMPESKKQEFRQSVPFQLD
jgi:uncharacterized protein YegJ (DUF2314 family)